MKKIGEISALYHVSNRMLRYYEEKGIINSSRGNNNYRYYNEEAEQRINQICLLKKLEFSTTEIDEVFRTKDNLLLIRLLYVKLGKLKNRLEELNQLSTIIYNFIALLNQSNNPFFHSLELSLSNPNTILRSDNMSQEVLRIINVPNFKVASFKGFSSTPENDAHDLANAFIKQHHLESFRHFGFNNPSPSKDGLDYGYEIWITIDKDCPEVTTKNIQGGLYASLTTSMDHIYENWQKLYQQVANSLDYVYDFHEPKEDGTSDHQWLEEITDYEYFSNPLIDFSSKQLDLLLPIKRKYKI